VVTLAVSRALSSERPVLERRLRLQLRVRGGVIGGLNGVAFHRRGSHIRGSQNFYGTTTRLAKFTSKAKRSDLSPIPWTRGNDFTLIGTPTRTDRAGRQSGLAPREGEAQQIIFATSPQIISKKPCDARAKIVLGPMFPAWCRPSPVI